MTLAAHGSPINSGWWAGRPACAAPCLEALADDELLLELNLNASAACVAAQSASLGGNVSEACAPHSGRPAVAVAADPDPNGNGNADFAASTWCSFALLLLVCVPLVGVSPHYSRCGPLEHGWAYASLCASLILFITIPIAVKVHSPPLSPPLSPLPPTPLPDRSS